MNKLMIAAAVACTLAMSQASAGEGQVSQSGLAAFGLSGLQTMTDAEGLQIRGQRSFALVGGGSFSRLGGSIGPVSGDTGTVNGYLAGARNRRRQSRASGANGSASGGDIDVRVNQNGNRFRFRGSVSIGSEGFSRASAQ